MEEFFKSPDGIIIKRLRGLFNRYNKEGKENIYHAIDYLSEWAILHSTRERHIIEIIRQKLEQNLFDSSNEKRLKLLDFYDSHIFKECAETPERFMHYLIGERDWQKVQYRITLRSPEYKKEVMDDIEKKLSKKNYLEAVSLETIAQSQNFKN